MIPRLQHFKGARGASAWLMLFALLFALASCSSSSSDSDGDGSGDGSSDGEDGACGVDGAPYLTSQPTVSPTEGVIDDDNNFFVTLTAAATEEITTVYAWIYNYDTDQDSGTTSYVAGGIIDQTEGSEDEWSGTLTDIPESESIPQTPGPHYLHMVFTDLEDVYTYYWRFADQSEEKYYCIQISGADSEDPAVSPGLSTYDIVTVDMEEAP